MRSIAFVLLVGCTVSTSRFESLEPCRRDAHCPPGHRCVEGLCAVCAGEDGGCLGGLPDGSVPCVTAADCDDGDDCNGISTCMLGRCIEGEPLDCSAIDDPALCVVGECLGGTCLPKAAADGTPCQDGSFCLAGDVCQAGTCMGGEEPACDDGEACTVDVCNEAADSCTSAPGLEGPAGDLTCADDADNDCDGQTDDDDPDCAAACPTGTACDDGLFCNGPDECQSDVCVPLGSPPCTADALPCTTTCDEAVDACNVLLPNTCVIAGACYAAGVLNPANVCQECMPSASTTNWTNDNSNSCINGLFCDSLDECLAGVCTSTGSPACVDDGLACTTTCDEATDSCNVVDAGACLIDGICRALGDADPGNPCQECTPTSDPTGWTSDDSNACADAYSCTTDSCVSGTCIGAPGGTCGVGEVCLPQCFGGVTGCGTPPTSLTLSCPTPEPVAGASACSVTLAGGTTVGQAACISCQAEVGARVLGHADFEECPGTLDGFAPTSGSPTCVDAGNHFLEASNASWTIERTFDTTGLDQGLELCFSYAESGMDTGDTLTVSACADGTCATPVVLLADTAGPSSGDTGWHRYCLDLDAHEPLAISNAMLVVRIAAVSATSGHLVQIDDVDLRGRPSGCDTTAVVLDEDVFSCMGSACDVFGWTAGPGCDISNPCAGTGLRAGSMETLELCRGIDLTGTIGDVFLTLDVGENGGDEGAAAETFSLEVCDGAPDASCGCAAGWQPAIAHTGDLDGLAVLASMRHFLVNLAGGALTGATVGVRLVANASGPGDLVEIDRVGAGTIDYLCPSGNLSIGALVELGGGSYTVDLGSDAATTAQLHCDWENQFPPVDDRATVEFLP